MHLLDPKLDIVFKMLMVRNPDLIRAQLEAVLGEPVLEFDVLNPEIAGDLTTDKYIVLDLRVRLKSGKRVDVEMQARTHDALTERVLYYAARDCRRSLRLSPTPSALCTIGVDSSRPATNKPSPSWHDKTKPWPPQSKP